MKVLALLIAVMLVGCVGVQNVREYERIDGKMIMTKQVKAYILGTSGQKIKTKNMTIEKKDAVDQAVGVVKDGISAALTVASGNALK